MSSNLPPLHSTAAKRLASPAAANIRDLVYGGEDVKRFFLRQKDDAYPIGLPFNPGLYPLNAQKFSRVDKLSEEDARRADKAANVGKSALMPAPPAPKA